MIAIDIIMYHNTIYSLAKRIADKKGVHRKVSLIGKPVKFRCGPATVEDEYGRESTE